MRKLIVILVIVLGAGAIADVSTKAWAQTQIVNAAKSQLPDSIGVGAHIHGFPFLVPIALAGKVSEVDGHFTNVKLGLLPISAVDIELHNVKINRHELISHRRVELVSISEGTVAADITAKTLSDTLHQTVTIANGKVRVTIGGAVSVDVAVAMVGNVLSLSAGGVSLKVPIPRTSLVPCATEVTALAGRVRLSCTVHQIPPALLRAANKLTQ
jgi:DUF2993 family protein